MDGSYKHKASLTSWPVLAWPSASGWRSFDYDDIIKRDKANLDIFWLKDDSLGDSENLPDPEILAQEIVDDLQTALESFASIAAELK